MYFCFRAGAEDVSLLDEITLLKQPNILVAVQDIVRTILLLESLKAIECFNTEGSTHAFNWLIGPYVVDVSRATE